MCRSYATRTRTPRGKCFLDERDGEITWSFMEVLDDGECGRLGREYGEWKEKTRGHREAKEYRKFLEEPDVASEDTETADAGLSEEIEATNTDHEDVTELDGNLNVLFEKRQTALDREIRALLERRREERRKELIKSAK